MEPSPFHHPFLMNDQCLATTPFYADPYEHVFPTASIEVVSTDHGNQPSIYANNLEILDSSMSTAIHDHLSEIKNPGCTAQSNHVIT